MYNYCYGAIVQCTEHPGRLKLTTQSVVQGESRRASEGGRGPGTPDVGPLGDDGCLGALGAGADVPGGAPLHANGTRGGVAHCTIREAAKVQEGLSSATLEGAAPAPEVGAAAPVLDADGWLGGYGTQRGRGARGGMAQGMDGVASEGGGGDEG